MHCGFHFLHMYCVLRTYGGIVHSSPHRRKPGTLAEEETLPVLVIWYGEYGVVPAGRLAM